LLAKELENQEMREELTTPLAFYMTIWESTKTLWSNTKGSSKCVVQLVMFMEKPLHIIA
jgi:hypothetical protein